VAYFLDLFSPETHKAFTSSNRDVSGFRIRQRQAAERIQKGDKLVCYVTKISRWVGLLQVVDAYFEDATPLFYPKDDPFVIRFHVNPIVWIGEFNRALPIHDQEVWKTLSTTRDYPPQGKTWTGPFRASLNRMIDEDGEFLEKLLHRQSGANPKEFPLTEADTRLLKRHTIRREDQKEVEVVVPVDEDEDVDEPIAADDKAESKKMQALIAQIGERMGLKVWLPRADRGRVLQHWKPEADVLLDELPLNYDEVTIKTIEQIDVIWLKRRSIVRAFEVEHTTAIHSGILRMADLMALQPNLDIRAHIVAPIERKDRVLQEIARPVFTLLEKGPLSNSCTYISYDSLKELASEKHLEHMTDSVVDEFIEEVD